MEDALAQLQAKAKIAQQKFGMKPVFARAPKAPPAEPVRTPDGRGVVEALPEDQALLNADDAKCEVTFESTAFTDLGKNMLGKDGQMRLLFAVKEPAEMDGAFCRLDVSFSNPQVAEAVRAGTMKLVAESVNIASFNAEWQADYAVVVKGRESVKSPNVASAVITANELLRADGKVRDRLIYNQPFVDEDVATMRAYGLTLLCDPEESGCCHKLGETTLIREDHYLLARINNLRAAENKETTKATNVAGAAFHEVPTSEVEATQKHSDSEITREHFAPIDVLEKFAIEVTKRPTYNARGKANLESPDAFGKKPLSFGISGVISCRLLATARGQLQHADDDDY